MTERVSFEWALVTLLCAALAMAATWAGWLWRIDQVAYDAAMSVSRPAADPQVVIVAIDDPSLAEIGRWPWRRSVHAALIERLTRAGARSIVMDIILSEPNDADPAADAALATAIADSGRVVLPLVQATRGNAIVGEAPPAPLFAAASAGVGHIHVEFDPDGIARSIYLWEGAGAARHPQLGLAALQQAEPARATAYPAPEPGAGAGWHRAEWLRIPFAGPPGSFRYVSYADVLRGDVDDAVLRDKVVFVGATAAGMADSVPTPTSGFNRPMPGVEVNANVYAALKRGEAVHLMPPPIAAALAGAIVVLLMGLMLRAAPRNALLIAFAGSAATLGLGWAVLQDALWWFPPAGAVLGCTLCYPLWSWRRLEAAQRHLDDQLEVLDRDAAALFPAMQIHLPRIKGVDPLQARIRRVDQAVQRQRDLHRFVVDTLDHLPVGAVVTNPAHQVMLCNQEATRLLGAAAPQAVAQAIASLEWPPGMPIEDGMPVHGGDTVRTVELDTANGARLLVSVAGLADSAGRPIGSVFGLADITRIHDAQRSREETMHYLSHDMRSPIASILTLIETEQLLDDSDARDPALLGQLARYARSALNLADDLFRLVRADAIDASQFKEISLAAVMQDAADEIWALAKARGTTVALEIDAHGHDEGYVRGDRDLLRRALVNLLGNAVKYGAADSTIELALRRDAAFWVVSVRDHGEGIRQDLLPRLFHRFGRLPTAASRREAGIGLGLMIVKTVAERHGGRASVHSQPGQGTTFSLHLPVLAA
ncbi:CHASE2 domain-containing protein [Denitromonas iodatirespirans]|uniref:histidine kinase n=1 Tax=Denitromonas iodatirespirans TaxID=2795389 RepID=A0A944D840_DENI1|nr:CHASE2 domain-containing protein [Denitromonas iodatirespirans]MBT0960081.1 CHASE2 domain-containing protein [Denitromonas iodatirespirans]